MGQLGVTKALSILGRHDKGLNHLCFSIVPAKLVQLIQPEIIACQIVVRCILRVAPQIAKVLHLHEGRIVFGIVESLVLCNLP